MAKRKRKPKHKFTIRTSLPAQAWRLLNRGEPVKTPKQTLTLQELVNLHQYLSTLPNKTKETVKATHTLEQRICRFVQSNTKV